MDLVQPAANIDVDNAPTITLGARSFYVPRFFLRQNIKITGLAAKMRRPPQFPLDATPEQKLTIIRQQPAPSEEELMVLAQIVHCALTRAYPTMTFNDLFDSEIAIGELNDAIATIMQQTRAAEKQPEGEAIATSQ